MPLPAGFERSKQLCLLQYRTKRADLGTVTTYLPKPEALELAWEVAALYKKRFGDAKSGVQPPYRALEAVLRAVVGDWARFQVQGDRVELIAGREISAEDRRDVFTFWAEAVLPGDHGHDAARRLADLLAEAEPRQDEPLPKPDNGRRSARWWPGELARWRLAQHLSAITWNLGGPKPVTFTLCSDGNLAALGHEVPGPVYNGRTRYILPRIMVGTAATGHSPHPALTITGHTTLLANSWYGVSTVLLANPGQPLAVAAHTDGMPWNRRLNVPAVEVSRRLAALPRLSKRLYPYPPQLDDAAIATTNKPDRIWAVAPVSAKTPGLGRGNGMELFRRIEAELEKECEDYRDRSPVYLEVPGLALPPGAADSRVDGPIHPERLPASLDAAAIDHLLVTVLWSTDEVRSRLQREIADQWRLGERFVAPDTRVCEVLAGRVSVLFLRDKAAALANRPATIEQRHTLLDIMLAPYRQPQRTVAALCETDWDPDRRHENIEAQQKAEAEDGKHPSKQALARLQVSTQYVNHAPPPVPTLTVKGTAQSEKFIKLRTERRDASLKCSTELAVRDLLRGLGLVDHRIGTAFGKVPIEPWWHVGIHVRRHTTRRTQGQRPTNTPPQLTVTLAAMRPTGGKDDPWFIWAYSPQAGRWLPHNPARLTVHAGDLGIDVTGHQSVGEESSYAATAAVEVEAALQLAATQLPAAGPMVLYVDGDTTEYIWAGLADEQIGHAPPQDLPRAASWLPGHGLPRAQRPIAVVRVIKDLNRIGRPTRTIKTTKEGEVIPGKTTNSLYQQACDDGTGFLPEFLLCTVPRTWRSGKPGRFADTYTRYAAEAEGKQGKNAYAHTGVRFTVIPTADDVDTKLIGMSAAILTNQAIGWDERQTEPTPLRVAHKIDTDHPYYRRTNEDEYIEPDKLAGPETDKSDPPAPVHSQGSSPAQETSACTAA
jgi:hypothetical protein